MNGLLLVYNWHGQSLVGYPEPVRLPVDAFEQVPVTIHCIPTIDCGEQCRSLWTKPRRQLETDG